MSNPEKIFQDHYKRQNGIYPDDLVMKQSQYIFDAMRDYAIERYIESIEFGLKRDNPLYFITMDMEYTKHLKESNESWTVALEELSENRKRRKK